MQWSLVRMVSGSVTSLSTMPVAFTVTLFPKLFYHIAAVDVNWIFTQFLVIIIDEVILA